MSIEIKGIKKTFGKFQALKGIDLQIESGELIALLGPSGSGKTTLLRIIAGLDVPDSGAIYLHGEKAHEMTMSERQVGFVFQHYALFKHMTVFDNIAFGLRVRPSSVRPSRRQIREKVHQLLALLHLESFHGHYPSQLSGGQRQRVALARALAVQPKVLLLDEPFGALDAKVRQELRRWLRKLHETLPITTIFVTHDQEEALEVADRLVVMSYGQIEQVGTPDDVYHRPTNSFVYDFLGHYNEFDGWRDAQGTVHLVEYEPMPPKPPVLPPEPSRWSKWIPPFLFRFFGRQRGDIITESQEDIYRAIKGEGMPIKVFARPHEMLVSRSMEEGQEYVSAFITYINPAGPLVKMELERVNGSTLLVELSREIVDELELKRSDRVFVRPRTMRVFD